MTAEKFIEYVAPRIVVDSLQRNLLPSPRIAQAIFESKRGESELAVHANNLFGLKANDQWSGRTYSKETGEYKEGTAYRTNADFQAYDSWTESIYWQGWYLENRYISKNNPDKKRYANLKGVRDYRLFARLLKEDGYGTAPDYAQRVTDYIERYHLAGFDSMSMEEAEDMAGRSDTFILALDAGHGLHTAGKRCMKSIDPAETREWVLNARIAEKVIRKLAGYPVQIIRTDDPDGQTDVPLAKRCKTANDASAALFLSIHHNAGINGGTGGGVVVYSYDDGKTVQDEWARRLYESVAGRNRLAGNRVSKCLKKDFYVLCHTNMKALLLENGFMDSRIDTPVILTDAHAEKTADGIVDFVLQYFGIQTRPEGEDSTQKVLYKVQVGAFRNKAYAERLRDQLKKQGYDAMIAEMQEK